MSIKECPFCGSAETHVIKACVGNDWSVECMGCEAIGPLEYGSDVAIKAWNEGTPRYHRVFKLEEALKRIRDCDWVQLGGPPKWLSEIAREALE